MKIVLGGIEMSTGTPDADGARANVRHDVRLRGVEWRRPASRAREYRRPHAAAAGFADRRHWPSGR